MPLDKWFAEIVFTEVPVGFGVRAPAVVLWLIFGACFFTLRFARVHRRALGQAVRLILGRAESGAGHGEVSHFQALSTALSGTVGVGNMANVAVAIALGGPGVTFWMILAGFLGMACKMVECTLGVKYRRHNPDGTVSGGPMFYLRAGLAERGFRRLGATMGYVYAVGIVVACFGSGNMFQANQAYAQFRVITGGDNGWMANREWLFGAVLAVVVGSVLLGGIKKIARVTSRLVPFMALLYMSLGLTVLALNHRALPGACRAILEGAFRPEGVAGGAIAVMVMGFQRAVFSNEAGLGTASIAHSAVRTEYPASEGIVGLLEPLIDTVILCSITAFVIVTTMEIEGATWGAGLTGIELTSLAFARHFDLAPELIALCALLFAFSTILSWCYYGLKGWTFLFGEGERMQMLFKFAYCAAVVVGCTASLERVMSISDALLFTICVPNLIGMIILAPVVREELDRYFSTLRRPAEAASPELARASEG